MDAPDIDFISNVKALADNGTLHRVLDMLEAECIVAWKASPLPDERERAWYTVQAVYAVKAKIKNLASDEKIRQFNNRHQQQNWR